MKEVIVYGDTLPESYHKALLVLNKYGEIYPCPDWGTKQKEVSLTMFVQHPLQEPMISKLFIGGFRELEQYRQEILDGILDFEVDRGNWSYTYHKIMSEQIPFIISELKNNPYSRRAVIDIRDWKIDSESNEPACLQHIQYFIRDNALHCKVLFRSNDAVKATFMNAFALIMLQQRIANELGYDVGTYTHKANSFHCYAKDYSLLNGYCSRLSTEDNDAQTYYYVGDWQDLMDEVKPEISNMVKELMKRSHNIG